MRKESYSATPQQSPKSGITSGILNFYAAIKPDLLFYGSATVLAFAGKLFYSLAREEELLFLLGPVTFLVSAFTGIPFAYDPGDGYVNRIAGIVIGKSCAGMNYLILLYAMTVFSFLRYFTKKSEKILFQFAALAGSFLLCIYATAARIIVSIPLISAGDRFPFLKTDIAHKIVGILVYVTILLLYYNVAEYFLKKAAMKKQARYLQKEGKSCKP
jgi:exosortase K